MTNKKDGVLYVGITNNICRRVYEHRRGIGSKFVKKYQLHRLVHLEQYNSPIDTIRGEKQLKAGSRSKKYY